MKLVITAIDHRKSLSLEEKADKVVDEVEKYLGDASEEDGEEALQETAFTLIQNAMERFKYTDPEIANLATEKLGFSKESKVRIHISAIPKEADAKVFNKLFDYKEKEKAEAWIQEQLSADLTVMIEQCESDQYNLFAGPTEEDIFDFYADKVPTENHCPLVQLTKSKLDF